MAVLEMGLAIDLYRTFESGRSGFQLAEKLMIFDPLAYHAAADGITVLFVMLSALVVLLLTIYGLVRGLPEPSRLLASILAVEGVLMSLLVSTNLLWFVLASAVEIALVGYLLWHWATSPEKDMMVTRFYQFQGTGILLLLLGVILLGWVHAEATGGDWSFELTALLGMQISPSLASVIFFLLFYGMGIRTPIFPCTAGCPWSPSTAMSPLRRCCCSPSRWAFTAWCGLFSRFCPKPWCTGTASRWPLPQRGCSMPPFLPSSSAICAA